jgi:hypothetical protein
MEPLQHVNKYQVAAKFREGIVEWSVLLETDDGEHYTLLVRDGEEIPVLLDICRRDPTIYFNPQTQTLSTGWNDPGGS